MLCRCAKQLVTVPADLAIWTWLFDSDYSPLKKHSSSNLGGYTNAITGERLSWADVKRHTTHLSTALVERYGLKPGETVALFSPNTVWYPVAVFAIHRAGGVMSGASPAYTADEMAYALKVSQAKFLMTVPGSMEVAAVAAEQAGLAKENIFLLEGEMSGYTNIKQLISAGEECGETGQIPPFRIPAGETNRDVVAFLSFSSGTTGLPKAVMIAHSNMISQVVQVAQITRPEYRKALAVLPLFHITGLVHLLHLPIYLNIEVYMMPFYNLETMLNVISKNRIKDLCLVPPIIIQMTRAPKSLRNKYDCSFMENVMSGAAPLSAEILQVFQERFPQSTFKQGYGMTESCSCITLTFPQFQGYAYAHYAGNIVASTLVKIVDPTSGKDCGYEEEGEIWARGPQIVMGYLNNETATRETFDKDGYLHTGDIGKIDNRGLLLVTDRLKEMIKVKGIPVAPAELEDLLLGHELVEDCAVLGIKDDLAGERPKAYIVLRASAAADEQRLENSCQALMQYVKDKKNRNKWIVEFEVADEIPKSASGKILRRVLRDISSTGAPGRNSGKSATRKHVGFVFRDKSRTERAKL
ncbi:putative 4-coumarateligase 2 [Phaeomoniella chlamydospora]|uniref:Putative 4-coumarateligase 2 n=1 Tax=Phaeomoniella chlamydospora TaxID=158046 RepID=A0A0G2GKI6_PHACM|nr:putative 4-coumarateligase 2 [Phaeomoniella chlamydospora]